jgi:hypothetical protein
MIKLTRSAKPDELTLVVQQALTLEFQALKNPVWKKPYIENSLLAYSNNKCCYCETDVTVESKYMEVDHFHHKDGYPNEVVEWNNLLPSCKKCNTTKGSHDTILEPIIDPTVNNPRDHLRLWNYRLKPISDLGRMTIDTLNLNDQDRLVLKRAEIGTAIQDKIDDFNVLTYEYNCGVRSSSRTKNRIINGVKALLRECLPSSSYSATVSHIIAYDPEFANLKTSLMSADLWDVEHSALEAEAKSVAL